MNTPSDTHLLDTLRHALAEAAPAAPSPALLDAIRREAARRARRRRMARRAAFLTAALAAAAALVVAVLPPSAAPGPSSGSDVAATADSALRLLLFDATEARAALAAESDESGDSTETLADASVDDAAEDDIWDTDTLSLSDALLAWQEAPLEGLLDEESAVF